MVGWFEQSALAPRDLSSSSGGLSMVTHFESGRLSRKRGMSVGTGSDGGDGRIQDPELCFFVRREETGDGGF